MKQIGVGKNANIYFPFITLFIVRDRESEFKKRERKDFDYTIQVRKEHFYLPQRDDWEMKDVVIMGLPQELRFLRCYKWIKKESERGLFYLFFVGK